MYNRENPFEATKLQLGVYPSVFTSIEPAGENSYFVNGENFTASSRLEVNKELMETRFISPTQLLVQNLELEDGDVLDVATQSNSSTKKVLSRTETQVYDAPEATPTPEPAGTPDPAADGKITEETENSVTPEPEGEPDTTKK